MSEKEDIARFVEIGDALKWIHIPSEDELILSRRMIELSERSALYLEFMAAAFLQETGLKASEAELVVSYGVDKTTFSFRRRENATDY